MPNLRFEEYFISTGWDMSIFGEVSPKPPRFIIFFFIGNGHYRSYAWHPGVHIKTIGEWIFIHSST
jgi:hypothetical protein